MRLDPGRAGSTTDACAPAARPTAGRCAAHDAKALHALAARRAASTCSGAASSTRRSPPTCIDPAETRYELAELLERYTRVRSCRPTTPRPTGQLDFDGDGDRRRRRAPPAQALAVSRLAPALEAALEAQGMRDAVRRRSRTRWCGVLARMEHVGIGVDVAELRAAARPADRRGASASASELVRGRRPRRSTSTRRSQLREILFDERGLTPQKKTKTGFSTDAASLEKLRDQWPEFIDPLLPYREVEKLRSTYGEGLLAEVAPDGRIHATFNQTVARTGRLVVATSRTCTTSRCAPRRAGSSAGRSSPRPGSELLVADYNQIELRCIAHLAEDPGLIAAFTGGQDIHNATASRVFGVEPGDGHPRAALEGEDGVVRPGLRHGGLRARPAAEHPDRGGGRASSTPTSWRSRT